MTITDFSEKILGKPLISYQKKYLSEADTTNNIVMPKNIGRKECEKMKVLVREMLYG